jgi:hypothetical protein
VIQKSRRIIKMTYASPPLKRLEGTIIFVPYRTKPTTSRPLSIFVI